MSCLPGWCALFVAGACVASQGLHQHCILVLHMSFTLQSLCHYMYLLHLAACAQCCSPILSVMGLQPPAGTSV